MSVGTNSIFVRITIIRKLFKVVFKGAETKIRIPKVVYAELGKHFDKVIEAEVKKIIDRIPKKQRGDSKGELKRLTLKIEDLMDENSTEVIEEVEESNESDEVEEESDEEDSEDIEESDESTEEVKE